MRTATTNQYYTEYKIKYDLKEIGSIEEIIGYNNLSFHVHGCSALIS